MSRNPRVAVIVPMHDSERYLEQTVASIGAQTYRYWHAVLVDDASGDRTPELAGRLAARDPERFTVIRLSENVGVAGARNAGVEAAPETELIALLDHDDRWLPEYLERAIAAFDAGIEAGRRVGIVASDALIDDGSGLTGRRYSDLTGRVGRIDYDSMIERNMICARALVSRRALLELGGFCPECSGHDDHDLWLRIIEAGYVVEVVPEALAVYRRHEDALSRNEELMFSGAIATFSRALERNRLTPRQRRAIRARIRHHRALLERARVRRALRDRDLTLAGRRALRAAPWGLIAFLQAPRRWAEWVCLRPERPRRTLS